MLSSGVIEGGARRDVIEVHNLAAAIAEMEEALRHGTPMTAGLLRHLHKWLLAGLDDSNAGRYRSEDVAISGAKVRPPAHHDVPILIQRVFDAASESNSSVHPVQRSAWVHWAISRIHPFTDGNGRAARLVQDFALLERKYVPGPLQAEDREGGYYAALEAADLGDGRPLVELVAKNVLRMADRYLSIIRDDEATATWINQITKAATEKVRQSDHRRFLAIQRALNLVKGEFQQTAEDLSGRIPDLRVSFRDYGALDFDKFTELESGGTAPRTWLFGVEFRI